MQRPMQRPIQRRVLLSALSLLSFLLLATPALAVCNDGEPVLVLIASGNNVEGEVSCGDGRDAKIQVLGVGHSLARAWSGGGTTGAVITEPITIIKPIDKSSPLIFQALAQNQSIEAEIQFFGDPTAPDAPTYTMVLTNAQIVSISSATGAGESEPTEAVSIIWNTLTVTDTATGAAYTYTWTSQS